MYSLVVVITVGAMVVDGAPDVLVGTMVVDVGTMVVDVTL